MTPTSSLKRSAIPRPNDKRKIVQHYNKVSPYYHSLWGEHLHHGYWIRGDESKEQAQLQLAEYLAGLANVPQGAEVLDIGCGFGASSLFLARKFKARPTGVNISPVQIEMARNAAAAENLDAQFLLMDAEALDFDRQFDLLWSVESISHYHDRRKFFANAARFLKPGGVFAVTDWLKSPGLTPQLTSKYIRPIEQGMFIEMDTMDDYASYLVDAGLQILHRQNITRETAKTWDLGLHVISDPSFWTLAAKLGKDFLTYLKSYRTVHAAVAKGYFVYALFVAQKPIS